MEDWNRQKAVGNIAESIVEMMINSMPNWKCIKFGVENHIEELKKNDLLNFMLVSLISGLLFYQTFLACIKVRDKFNNICIKVRDKNYIICIKVRDILYCN